VLVFVFHSDDREQMRDASHHISRVLDDARQKQCDVVLFDYIGDLESKTKIVFSYRLILYKFMDKLLTKLIGYP
jgi:hypothetical protein